MPLGQFELAPRPMDFGLAHCAVGKLFGSAAHRSKQRQLSVAIDAPAIRCIEGSGTLRSFPRSILIDNGI